jgi:hypothetical protein
MNLTPNSAVRRLKRMVNLAERYQSHLSLLWHNVNFDPIDFPFWGSVYWSILRYAIKKNGWITTLNDIYNEWVTLS